MGAGATEGARRRGRRPAPVEPLGSLTRQDQQVPVGTQACTACGATRLTRLRLTLADGTEVTFVSCHACEHRAWVPVDGDGTPLTREQVMERSAKR
ncbi:hypothetical protein [Cellulomonas sp. NPDC089187]|uniref:hypothetical protein n=1 Tax=Cellulomonas sp. NPDC089187 TaxID=3154970 RepID=UPI0034322EB4